MGRYHGRHAGSVLPIQLSVHAPGAAAEAAAERKIRKYESISRSHHFVPVAFESLGPICSAGLGLIGEVGSAPLRLTIHGKECFYFIDFL